jgi:hypothetical protein
MGKTFRNIKGDLFDFDAAENGIVRDGKTLSKSKGYRDYKEMRRREERRRAKQALREGKEPEETKKDDKYWW